MHGLITYRRSSRYTLGNCPVDPSTFTPPPGWKSLPIYTYIHGITAQSTESFIGRAPHAEWDSGLSGHFLIPPTIPNPHNPDGPRLRITPVRLGAISAALDDALRHIHGYDIEDDDPRHYGHPCDCDLCEWYDTPRAPTP